MPFVGDAAVAVKQVDDVNWELIEPLTYQGNHDTFIVPIGQRTDFASVPRVFIWFLPRYGRYTKAAVLHDYLWRELAATGKMRWVDADGIFRRAMRELGVSFLKRWVMWAAVRFAGMFKQGGRKGWTNKIWAAVLVSLVSMPFVLPAGVVILASLLGFFILENVVYLPIAISKKLRSGTKMVNAPEIRMKA